LWLPLLPDGRELAADVLLVLMGGLREEESIADGA
jgi:hypothetical protein